VIHRKVTAIVVSRARWIRLVAANPKARITVRAQSAIDWGLYTERRPSEANVRLGLGSGYRKLSVHVICVMQCGLDDSVQIGGSIPVVATFFRNSKSVYRCKTLCIVRQTSFA